MYSPEDASLLSWFWNEKKVIALILFEDLVPYYVDVIIGVIVVDLRIVLATSKSDLHA